MPVLIPDGRKALPLLLVALILLVLFGQPQVGAAPAAPWPEPPPLPSDERVRPAGRN